jgi:hypothetical protein
MLPSNSTPRYTPKKNKTLCLHKNLCTSVHRGIIYNSQNTEITKCPSSDRKIKYGIYLYNGMLTGNKNEVLL